jgi:hypothetical protein
VDRGRHVGDVGGGGLLAGGLIAVGHFQPDRVDAVVGEDVRRGDDPLAGGLDDAALSHAAVAPEDGGRVGVEFAGVGERADEVEELALVAAEVGRGQHRRGRVGDRDRMVSVAWLPAVSMTVARRRTRRPEGIGVRRWAPRPCCRRGTSRDRRTVERPGPRKPRRRRQPCGPHQWSALRPRRPLAAR